VPSASPARKNIVCPLPPWFLAPISSASTMSADLDRNSTTPSAPSFSKRFRAKVVSILSASFRNLCARALATQYGALLSPMKFNAASAVPAATSPIRNSHPSRNIALIAKPLAAGLPLGAILASEPVASRVSPGMHGTTFGGGRSSCATALEFLESRRERETPRKTFARVALSCAKASRSSPPNLTSSAKFAAKG